MKKGSLQLGSPEIIAVRGLDAKVQAWAGEGASIEHVDFLMEGVSCRLPCGPLWREPSEGSGYDALALAFRDPTTPPGLGRRVKKMAHQLRGGPRNHVS